MITASLLLAAAAPSRCFVDKVINNVPISEYIGDRACVDLDPPRTFSGIWVLQFEGSTFVEGAKTMKDVQGRRHTTWLTVDRQSVMPFRTDGGYNPTYYRVTFTGRSAADMNAKPLEGYGHFNMYPGLVVVDRMTSLKQLPAD